MGWQSVRTISDQMVALRLVVLADRLYDCGVPVFASGESLDQLFAPELLRGGYRKKCYRALSRLVALARGATSGRAAAPRTDTPQAQRPAPGGSR